MTFIKRATLFCRKFLTFGKGNIFFGKSLSLKKGQCNLLYSFTKWIKGQYFFRKSLNFTNLFSFLNINITKSIGFYKKIDLYLKGNIIF